METSSIITIQTFILNSFYLARNVTVDVYAHEDLSPENPVSLLLINDGQNLAEMKFETILDNLYAAGDIRNLICVGIHVGKDRKVEYGTANVLDYKGRGAKAEAYGKFLFNELLPYLKKKLSIHSFKDKSFCGFSLGGLTALDIVWNHPHEFHKVGVFSGSLWWRTVDQADPEFNEEVHRIMHTQVKNGSYHPWLKFFFETGILDETADRNNNGIIDSIDDTLSLIKELELKGYELGKDIKYLELHDGRHDLDTWARAFPVFLKWGWSNEK